MNIERDICFRKTSVRQFVDTCGCAHSYTNLNMLQFLNAGPGGFRPFSFQTWDYDILLAYSKYSGIQIFRTSQGNENSLEKSGSWRNVAKCNLGKVNLEAMPSSNLWTQEARLQPWRFAGAFCDAYTQYAATAGRIKLGVAPGPVQGRFMRFPRCPASSRDR